MQPGPAPVSLLQATAPASTEVLAPKTWEPSPIPLSSRPPASSPSVSLVDSLPKHASGLCSSLLFHVTRPSRVPHPSPGRCSDVSPSRSPPQVFRIIREKFESFRLIPGVKAPGDLTRHLEHNPNSSSGLGGPLHNLAPASLSDRFRPLPALLCSSLTPLQQVTAAPPRSGDTNSSPCLEPSASRPLWSFWSFSTI